MGRRGKIIKFPQALELDCQEPAIITVELNYVPYSKVGDNMMIGVLMNIIPSLITKELTN